MVDPFFAEATAELLGFKDAPPAVLIIEVLISVALSGKSRARGFNDAARWKYYQTKVIFQGESGGTTDPVRDTEPARVPVRDQIPIPRATAPKACDGDDDSEENFSVGHGV